jgi:hypothetical protein
VSERYGGGISLGGQEFILQLSTVADNLSVNGMDIEVSSQSFESRGYNLLSNNDSLNPLLLPSDIVTGVYGLTLPTDGIVFLLADSPAKDAIPPAECAASVDQRGAIRPQGAGCDIGAVEMGP